MQRLKRGQQSAAVVHHAKELESISQKSREALRNYRVIVRQKNFRSGHDRQLFVTYDSVPGWRTPPER